MAATQYESRDLAVWLPVISAWVDCIWYQIVRFLYDNSRGEYVHQTFRLVLVAWATTYDLWPPHTYHKNGITKRMILTVTEKVQPMMIKFQAPIQFCSKAIYNAANLHRRSPNNGLGGLNGPDNCQAPYETPYSMLHRCSKPTHHADGSKIPYQAPLYNVCWFGCYASRLITKVHHQGKFSPKSIPCIIVGYTRHKDSVKFMGSRNP